MDSDTRTIIIQRRGNPGLLAGILGCVFGLFGIFTIGVLFVPLAAICSLIGLLRGIGGMSGTGIGLSLLGIALTAAGFVFSPSLWFLLAIGAAAH